MHRFPVYQSGSTLLVSLIILLVLTVVGVSSVNNISLNQKMATNYRDVDLAFQAAEAALAAGEAQVELLAPQISLESFNDCDSSSSSPCFTAECDAGRCFSGSHEPGNECVIDGDATPVHLMPETWTDENRYAALTGSAFSSLSEQPKFIVEFRCYVTTNPEAPPGDTSDEEAGNYTLNWSYFFKITSFARGRTDASRVMLQSTYKVNF